MGLLGGIKKAAKKVGKAVKKAANKVKKKVSDAGNAVGNAIENAGNAAANGLGGWAGAVIQGVTTLVGSTIKAAFDIVGNVISGALKIGAGILTLDLSLIGDGLGDIVFTLFGSIMVVGLAAIALVQTILPWQNYPRPLGPYELPIVRKIFHDSLNYNAIRIVEGRGSFTSRGAGFFGITNRANTFGNTIYMKDGYRNTGRMTTDDKALLVHEVTHVWQYQNLGSAYISEAAFAQTFVNDPYNWEVEIRGRNKTEWVDFNKEAQAEFFEDLYEFGRQVDKSVVPSGTIPTDFDIEGSFFEEPKDPNLDPIFPYFQAYVDPLPASGTVVGVIEQVTEIAVEATAIVRKG